MIDDAEYIKLVLKEYALAIDRFTDYQQPMYFDDKRDAVIVANHLRQNNIPYTFNPPNAFRIISPVKYRPTISVILNEKIHPEKINMFLQNYIKKNPPK